MARPRKSTLDGWLDLFAEWSSEDRAFALAQLQAIHRAISVSERRTAPEPAPRATLAGPATFFVGDKRIEGLSDLEKLGDAAHNAALDGGEEGPNQ